MAKKFKQKSPLEEKQEVLANGLCVLARLDGKKKWVCSAKDFSPCCVLADPSECPAIKDIKKAATIAYGVKV